jgi:hypothetical protein
MKKKAATEKVIDDLVAAAFDQNASGRERHIYREALRGLVRLARSEQMLEMRNNVDKLTGAITARAARRRAKSLVLGQRSDGGEEPEQKRFEFNPAK